MTLKSKNEVAPRIYFGALHFNREINRIKSNVGWELVALRPISSIWKRPELDSLICALTW